MNTNENLTGALDGVRVLDFSTMVAGPVATMMLADQGADVIKVATPGGDLMRHLSRGRNGMNAFVLACNRNKRSLSVDLKTELGREIVHKLIATADALTQSEATSPCSATASGDRRVSAVRVELFAVLRIDG